LGDPCTVDPDLTLFVTIAIITITAAVIILPVAVVGIQASVINLSSTSSAISATVSRCLLLKQKQSSFSVRSKAVKNVRWSIKYDPNHPIMIDASK
jgi:hypothetical protein